MVEASIILQGMLTADDIQEIHSMFLIANSNNTGQLRVQNLWELACQMGTGITQQEVLARFQMLDFNNDGVVTWEEFLQGICQWLHMRGFVQSQAGQGSGLSNKKQLHVGIAAFFAPDGGKQVVVQDDLEVMSRTNDYFGEGVVYDEDMKKQVYEFLLGCLEDSVLQKLVDDVNRTDTEFIYNALVQLRQCLTVLAAFSSRSERVNIGTAITKLFNAILYQGILVRVIQCLGATSTANIQWEALKILTVVAAGTNLPSLQENSNYSDSTIKNILIQLGAAHKFLELSNSNCIEVKEQSILALGFLVQNHPDSYEILKAIGCIPMLLQIFVDGLQGILENRVVIKTIWALCKIFEHNSPQNPIEGVENIVQTLANILENQQDELLLIQCLFGLSLIFPNIEVNQSNRVVLLTISQHIVNPVSNLIRRAAINCVRKCITDTAKAQIFLEQGLLLKLCENFTSSIPELKYDVCIILSNLISKGYLWEILSLNRLLILIQTVIIGDSDLRWESIRLIKLLTSQRQMMVTNILARFGFFDTLFNSLICFREISPMILQIYGVTCFSFNFTYLYDNLVTLYQMIASGMQEDGDNVFYRYLVGDEACKLFEVIKILVQELRIGNPDLYTMSHEKVNLQQAITDLITIFIKSHQSKLGKTNQTIVNYLETALEFANCSFRDANYSVLVNDYVPAENILELVQKFVTSNQNVKCISDENYPNGDNRLIRGLKRSELQYENLKSLINFQYGVAKQLSFIDPTGVKISIDSDGSMLFALFQSVKAEFDNYIFTFISNGQSVPSPLYMESVEIRIVVSGNDYQVVDQLPTLRMNSSFIDKKDQVLRELNQTCFIDIQELENLHSEFRRVAMNRGAEDGTVNFKEFQEILQRFTLDERLLNEIFNALDVEHSGFVDFRSFIAGLGVLRSGNIVQKIWLAFRAYDTTGKRGLNKIEVFNLLQSASMARQVNLSQDYLRNQVEHLFRVYDRNKDGVMDFEEFKEAVLSNSITLNPFWTSSNASCFSFQDFAGYTDTFVCNSCGRSFLPKTPKEKGLIECPQCAISNPGS